ncbi:hypothetical protein LZ554_004099 [Drepanopeziza brunnea f. sp. 'monogermtubi']|nr:hypothetical protein LZ554_004099 [Drepanopeziza brunnea f. sp. 'monogermtubi']
MDSVFYWTVDSKRKFISGVNRKIPSVVVVVVNQLTCLTTSRRDTLSTYQDAIRSKTRSSLRAKRSRIGGIPRENLTSSIPDHTNHTHLLPPPPPPNPATDTLETFTRSSGRPLANYNPHTYQLTRPALRQGGKGFTHILFRNTRSIQ